MQPTIKNLTDLSFTLEWSPVNNTELLQNYSLSYHSVSHLSVEKRQTDSKTVSIPAGSTSYTVDNLIPYSEYCFSLEAIYAQKGIVFSNKISEEICDINTPPIGEFTVNLPYFLQMFLPLCGSNRLSRMHLFIHLLL